MDGWETRRRRDGGELRLVRHPPRRRGRGSRRGRRHVAFQRQLPGVVRRSTCCDRTGALAADDLRRADWHEILPRTPLDGDAHNQFAVDRAPRAHAPAAQHLPRRRRRPPAASTATSSPTGRASPVAATSTWPPPSMAAWSSSCSDMFFGSRHNLIMPGDATHMGDGWETKRRRGTGHDWTIVRLGTPGPCVAWKSTRGISRATRRARAVSKVLSDPTHAAVAGAHDADAAAGAPPQHFRGRTSREIGDVTHVRFNIYPDGGVGRLRLFGRPRQPCPVVPGI